jgi:hypothetical protein
MPSDYDDSREDDDYGRCVLNAQPRGYWQMNERGGDFGDSAGGGRTALVLNADGLTYADARLVPAYGDACVRVTHAATVVDIGDPGPPSGPFAYVGVRPQIAVPDDPEIRGSGPFSLECWFYVDDPASFSSDPAERALLLHKVLVTGPPDATQDHIGYTLYFLGSTLVFQLVGNGSSGGRIDFTYTPFVANHLVVRLRPDGYLDGVLNGCEIVPTATVAPDYTQPFGAGAPVATAGPNDGAPLLIASDASDFVPEGEDPSGYTITFTTRAPHARVGHVAYYDYYLKDGMCAQHYAVGSASGVLHLGTVYTQPRRGQKVWSGDEPDGWTDRTFDDSGWGNAVVMTRDNSFSSFNVLVKPDGPRQIPALLTTNPFAPPFGMSDRAFWMCDDNLPFRGPTDRFLLRLPIRIGPTRPSAASATFFADDQVIDVYLNGTLLFSDDGITGGFPYAITTAQCNLFVLNATNVFAIRVTNGTYNADIGSDGAYDSALGVAFAFEQLVAGHLIAEQALRTWYALL